MNKLPKGFRPYPYHEIGTGEWYLKTKPEEGYLKRVRRVSAMASNTILQRAVMRGLYVGLFFGFIMGFVVGLFF